MATNTETSPHPLYVRLPLILVGILTLFYILYVGRIIIVPIVFAALIAILLNPLVNYLNDHGVNRILGITFSVLLTIAIVAGLIAFIFWQAKSFSDTFSQLEERFDYFYNESLTWTSETFNIAIKDIDAWVNQIRRQVTANSGMLIGRTITTISGMLAFVFLLPVYIFMILFYKTLLLDFIARLFRREQHDAVLEILNEIKFIIQSYLGGLLLETAIVAVLNSIGFLVVGLQYAILLGIIGAILNLIPYIGGLVAISLPMILALTTESVSTVVIVAIIYLVVQFIDNNIIVPRIVASRVRLNALVSIIAVLVGGAIWGIMGMFLAIPLVAITKVIFDRVEGLQPWGYLLGDDMPPITKQIFRPLRKRARKAS
ncbi:MAG: AI-2E family transporter [Saprospiraceae bacterium]